ncbi:unnamed protein product [Adineta ricciae]|uniref:RING-type domain-containing protein n=1 Tax=Adineta ricciae TaxID=249248 RepID=A0A816ER84_ADIRI|nr:unnamed protein product [Adineta ricciae]
MYACLFGEYPVSATKDHVTMANKVLNHTFNLPSIALENKIQVKELLLHLLEKDPNQRLCSLDELRQSSFMAKIDFNRVYTKSYSPLEILMYMKSEWRHELQTHYNYKLMQRRLSPILLFITSVIVKVSTMSIMEVKLNISFCCNHRPKYRIISSQMYYPSIPKTYYLLKGTYLSENAMRITQVKCIGALEPSQSCLIQSDMHLMFHYTSYLADASFKIKEADENIRYLFNRFASLSPSEMNRSNITCSLLFGSSTMPTRPTGVYPYPISNTSLFGIIFLSTCAVLVCGLCTIWFSVLYYRRFVQHRKNEKNRQALAKSTEEILAKSPVIIFDAANQTLEFRDENPMCAICLETFNNKDKIRKLACTHYYHIECIDPWLLSHQSCPLCNQSILQTAIPSISSIIEPPSTGQPTPSTHSDL